MESLDDLRRAAAGCKRCPLWEHATQTVFGEGPAAAQLMLVGEQPGDQEDRQGHTFVGPAGRVLDAALRRAGIDRSGIYVTNAVKHFKWEAAGKRRLHKKPTAREVRACRPWLAAEIEHTRPAVVVAMGTTAVSAVLQSSDTIESLRGRLIEGAPGEPSVVVTIHPSAVLRREDRREEFMAGLVEDLRMAASAAGAIRTPPGRGPG